MTGWVNKQVYLASPEASLGAAQENSMTNWAFADELVSSGYDPTEEAHPWMAVHEDRIASALFTQVTRKVQVSLTTSEVDNVLWQRIGAPALMVWVAAFDQVSR